MEIFFAILAALCSIAASVFGVRNRLRNRGDRGSKTCTNRGICSDGSGYNDLVSDTEGYERDQERIQELDERNDTNLERCSDISSKIRKRETETRTSE